MRLSITKLLLSAILGLALAAPAAETRLPAKQSSVVSSNWAVLSPTTNTVQSTFDSLDSLWPVRLAGMYLAASNALSAAGYVPASWLYTLGYLHQDDLIAATQASVTVVAEQDFVVSGTGITHAGLAVAYAVGMDPFNGLMTPPGGAGGYETVPFMGGAPVSVWGAGGSTDSGKLLMYDSALGIGGTVLAGVQSTSITDVISLQLAPGDFFADFQWRRRRGPRGDWNHTSGTYPYFREGERIPSASALYGRIQAAFLGSEEAQLADSARLIMYRTPGLVATQELAAPASFAVSGTLDYTLIEYMGGSSSITIQVSNSLGTNGLPISSWEYDPRGYGALAGLVTASGATPALTSNTASLVVTVTNTLDEGEYTGALILRDLGYSGGSTSVPIAVTVGPPPPYTGSILISMSGGGYYQTAPGTWTPQNPSSVTKTGTYSTTYWSGPVFEGETGRGYADYLVWKLTSDPGGYVKGYTTPGYYIHLRCVNSSGYVYSPASSTNLYRLSATPGGTSYITFDPITGRPSGYLSRAYMLQTNIAGSAQGFLMRDEWYPGRITFE